MKEEIKVPAMGESITEAVIGEILKPSGSYVEVEDEVLEIETDKINQVLYAPVSGTIEWSVNPEDTVAIGQVIGSIESKGEKPKQEPVKEKPAKEEVKPKPAAPITGQARISKEEALSEAPIEEKKTQVSPEVRETRKRMPKIRQVIAKRLVEVQLTTAMLTTFNEIDLTEVINMRAGHKESFLKEHGVKLGFMSFFVKGVLSALKAFPNVNAYIDGNETVLRHYYDIGIAVSTERGLIVPVVRDCDRLTFAQIEQSIAEFAKKAREGKISVDDLHGGGFTITNGGVFGSLLSTPILNAPQSGILGMHTIKKRPVAIDNNVVIRPMMYVALSYDHRIIDGKEAVSFLVHLKNHLEDPAQMLLET